MVKEWSADNPKAGLMARKRAAIVDAALNAFLERGYAESSVNSIAADAGVSIKTLYRHFESKDELFSAVMMAACVRPDDTAKPDWFSKPPEIALPVAGAEYLRHILSQTQLALYRVVVRDAHRFPKLGRSYQDETIHRRDAIFVSYLDEWAGSVGWKVSDKTGASAAYAGMLRSPLFEDALLGNEAPTETQILRHATRAAACMVTLLSSGRI